MAACSLRLRPARKVSVAGRPNRRRTPQTVCARADCRKLHGESTLSSTPAGCPTGPEVEEPASKLLRGWKRRFACGPSLIRRSVPVAAHPPHREDGHSEEARDLVRAKQLRLARRCLHAPSIGCPSRLTPPRRELLSASAASLPDQAYLCPQTHPKHPTDQVEPDSAVVEESVPPLVVEAAEYVDHRPHNRGEHEAESEYSHRTSARPCTSNGDTKPENRARRAKQQPTRRAVHRSTAQPTAASRSSHW